MATAPTMADWTPAVKKEPTVRVGIVLAEDQRSQLHLRTNSSRYQLALVDGSTVEIPPATDIGLRAAGEQIAVEAPGFSGAAGAPLQIIAATDASPLPALNVRDVVAGRGFHWQKNITQTLAGNFEVRAAAGQLVLVNELPLEEYLAGVITAEMNQACPEALLAAQCVVARAWLLAMTEDKHADDPFDRCNDDCCQRYQGCSDMTDAARQAVRATAGVALVTADGAVLDANYAKSCGGISEVPRTVWGHDKPGLSAVVDAPDGAAEHRFFPITEQNLDEYLDGDWLADARAYCSLNAVSLDDISRYLGRVDETDDYFRWTVTHSAESLLELLKRYLPKAGEAVALREVRVAERGVSGRAARVEITAQTAAGAPLVLCLESEFRIRQVLHERFLYSSAIAVRPTVGPDGLIEAVTLRGAGWGHGVGLCQIGALGMALAGKDWQTICRHYYPDAEIAAVY